MSSSANKKDGSKHLLEASVTASGEQHELADADQTSSKGGASDAAEACPSTMDGTLDVNSKVVSGGTATLLSPPHPPVPRTQPPPYASVASSPTGPKSPLLRPPPPPYAASLSGTSSTSPSSGSGSLSPLSQTGGLFSLLSGGGSGGARPFGLAGSNTSNKFVLGGVGGSANTSRGGSLSSSAAPAKTAAAQVDMMPTIPLIPVNVGSRGSSGSPPSGGGMLSKALRGGSVRQRTPSTSSLMGLSRSTSLTIKRGGGGALKIKKPFGFGRGGRRLEHSLSLDERVTSGPMLATSGQVSDEGGASGSGSTTSGSGAATSGFSSTATGQQHDSDKWRGDLCSLCNLGNTSVLGQGELKTYAPTPGYTPSLTHPVGGDPALHAVKRQKLTHTDVWDGDLHAASNTSASSSLYVAVKYSSFVRADVEEDVTCWM
ncbi:hypothetical protein FHG87_014605 [Trinorchestia longiramus]|nr:hypothetical protein FHG87_014605 [Trinorchestia longiramus]